MRARIESAGEAAKQPPALLALALALLIAAVVVSAQSTRAAVSEVEPAESGDAALPWFGFNELRWATAWQQGEYADDAAALNASVKAVADAGANTSRLPVPWDDVVDPVGGWDEVAWTRYRRVYDRMISRDIRPVIVLYAPPRGLDGDPNWAAPGCAGGLASIHDPIHDAKWQAYTVRASNEFDQALALQVWNEPNSRDYWGGATCTPDPVRYVQLAALARQALLAPGSEHPDRALVSAGLNPAGGSGTVDWRDYLRATIAAGLLDWVEAAGLHPYALPSDCRREFDPASALTEGAAKQLAEAEAIVPAPVPIWVTEFGASSAAGMTTDCRALSEADQARTLGATYDVLAASPRVELAILHQLVDEPAYFPEWLPNAFGVTRYSPRFLEPKPAYLCLAQRRGVDVDPEPACG